MARRDDQGRFTSDDDERNRRYGSMDPNRERDREREREGQWGRGREDEERYGRSTSDWRNRSQQHRGDEHEYERGFGSPNDGEHRGESGGYGRGREWDRENERYGGMGGPRRGREDYEQGGGFQRSFGEPGQMRYGREYDESERFGRDWRGQDPNQWNQYDREGQRDQRQYGGQGEHQGWGQQGRPGQWGGAGQWSNPGQGQPGGEYRGNDPDERWRGGSRDWGSEHRGEMGGRGREDDVRWGRGQHRSEEEQRRSWREHPGR